MAASAPESIMQAARRNATANLILFIIFLLILFVIRPLFFLFCTHWTNAEEESLGEKIRRQFLFENIVPEQAPWGKCPWD